MKKIQVDVYDQEIFLFESQKDIKKWLAKTPIHDHEEMINRVDTCAGLAGMLCPLDSDRAYWFIFLEEKDLGTLSHEAVHLAYMLLGLMGVEHDVHNHEAFAYLQGYIFKECARKLKLPILFG